MDHLYISLFKLIFTFFFAIIQQTSQKLGYKSFETPIYGDNLKNKYSCLS